MYISKDTHYQLFPLLSTSTIHLRSKIGKLQCNFLNLCHNFRSLIELLMHLLSNVMSWSHENDKRHTGQEDRFNLKKIDHDFWVNFLISGIILIARIAINNFWDNGPWRKWVFLIWPICHIYAPFNIVWKSALYVSFQFWMISNHCYDLKNELSTMQYPHLVTLNMIL